MNIVVEEANKLTVIDYFVAFCCEVFSIVEFLEEVANWHGWFPMGGHVIKIGCEIGGGDVSILSV